MIVNSTQTCLLYASPMWHLGPGPIMCMGPGPIPSIGPDLLSTSCKWSNPWHRTRSYVGYWTSCSTCSCQCIMLCTVKLWLWLHDGVKSKYRNVDKKILQIFTCELYEIIYCTVNTLYPLIRGFPFFSQSSQHLHKCY